MRAGLVSLLSRDRGIRVVGEAGSEAAAQGQIVRMRPDVVLLDERLCAGRSAETIAAIRQSSSRSAVLVVFPTECSSPRDFVEAGASGSIAKDSDALELVQAVRAVAGGATLLAPRSRSGTVEPDARGLSTREREILNLIASGRTNTEIGSLLFLATKTVERQVATIVGKLGARNRAHAAAMAVASGLVSLPRH